MLLLDSKQLEFDGITVFPDHADPMQYYYLPLMPHLTTVKDPAAGNAEVPQFSLIRFRGRAGTGGFLNFDVNIGAGDDRLDEIRRQIQNEERLRDPPRLAPVTTVSGTVRLLMLGKQSGDAATAAPGTEAGPQFVLKMDHSATPSLYGNNQAAFSIRRSSRKDSTVARKAGTSGIWLISWRSLRPFGRPWVYQPVNLRSLWRANVEGSRSATRRK